MNNHDMQFWGDEFDVHAENAQATVEVVALEVAGPRSSTVVVVVIPRTIKYYQ